MKILFWSFVIVPLVVWIVLVIYLPFSSWLAMHKSPVIYATGGALALAIIPGIAVISSWKTTRKALQSGTVESTVIEKGKNLVNQGGKYYFKVNGEKVFLQDNQYQVLKKGTGYQVYYTSRDNTILSLTPI